MVPGKRLYPRAYPHSLDLHVHLDISVSNRQQEVERVQTLGGSVVRVALGYTAMSDAQGNQFCIVERYFTASVPRVRRKFRRRSLISAAPVRCAAAK